MEAEADTGSRASIEKKKIKERFSMRKNGTNQTSNKWALRKRMEHATYNGKWKVIPLKILRSK